MLSSKWTLCVCLLPCLLNCSVSEVKTVRPGEDVLLLCQVSRGANIVFLGLKRRDLEPDYVFFVKDNRTNENPNWFLYGRVKLRDPQMKDGDASLILEKVNIKDTGTYECYVKTKGNRSELISRIHLKVEDSDQKQITVTTGDDVTLQCLDHRGGDIEVLEWMRMDLEKDVFVCRHGKMFEDSQQPSYKNRVELIDPEMKDGDVSVILKNVTIKDTGTYECHLKTGSRFEVITIITLTVVNSGGGAGYLQVGGVKDDCLGLLVALSVVTVLLVVVGGGGFMFYRKYKRLKKKINQLPADPQLPVLIPKSEDTLKEEEL